MSTDSIIRLKKSSVPAKVPQPGDLEFGELALNFADGKLYYKNSQNEVEFFSSAISEAPGFISGINSFLFIATTGQDTFTGGDANSNTLSYNKDFVQVYVNGVRLNPRDYTATNEQTVILADPVNTDDEVAIVTATPSFINNATSKRETFTANKNQTVFVIDGGYDAGFADVYLNGVKLVNDVDVDVSSGTEIILTEGAEEGDSVDVVAYGSFAFTSADHYTKEEADALLDEKANNDDLGTMSVQNADDVNITGGNIDATITYDNTTSGLISNNTQDAIDEIQGNIVDLENEKAESEFFTATVTGSSGTSDWSQASSSDPFIATLTVNGILSTDRPIVDIDLSGVDFEDVEVTQGNWTFVYRVEASDDDEIKLYAIDEPFSTFNILIKVVR